MEVLAVDSGLVRVLVVGLREVAKAGRGVVVISSCNSGSKKRKSLGQMAAHRALAQDMYLHN